MAQIKSSLQIALERTAHVTADPQQVEAHRYRQQGKKLVANLQRQRDLDIQAEISNHDDRHAQWIREGMSEMAGSIVSLPLNAEDLDKYSVLEPLLAILAPAYDGADQMVQQLEQIGHQYLEDKQHIIATVRERYRQRATEQMNAVAQQTGMSTHIDPSALPEFQQELADVLRRHNGQYEATIQNIRNEFEAIVSAQPS